MCTVFAIGPGDRVQSQIDATLDLKNSSLFLIA